jgi:hypothetical protein
LDRRKYRGKMKIFQNLFKKFTVAVFGIEKRKSARKGPIPMFWSKITGNQTSTEISLFFFVS